MSDLEARLRSLAYFSEIAIPSLASDYRSYEPANPTAARELSDRFGIVVTAGSAGNAIHVHRNNGRLKHVTPVSFQGTSNTVILGEQLGAHGSINFMGDNNLVVLLGDHRRLALEANLYAGDSLVCGRGTFAWGVRIWVQGGTVCTLGDDCLLSENISIRTTDHHSIIDLATGTQINAPRDIRIGNHVWLGPSCTVNKGVQIGDGAILAPHSVLTESIPRAECWGGVSARILRRNVSWVRSHPAEAREVDALRALLRSRGVD